MNSELEKIQDNLDQLRDYVITDGQFAIDNIQNKLNEIGQIIKRKSEIDLRSSRVLELLNTELLKKCPFLKDLKNFGLNSAEWDLVIDIGSELNDLFILLKVKNQNLRVERDEYSLKISWPVGEDSWNDDIMTDIYRLSRSFLLKRVILSYSLDKFNPESGLLFEIILTHERNLSVDKSGIKILVDKNNNDYVTISEALTGFKVNKCQYTNIGYHTTLVLDEKLQQFNNISNTDLIINQLDENDQFYHFPFLFRPLSIIIPDRGNISFGQDLKTPNEVEYSIGRNLGHVDLFDCLSK